MAIIKEVHTDGPDLSVHNGVVNIKSIRNAGYKRIGIRAGYGKNNVDQKYIANAQSCYNLSVDVLLYWFSYAYTTAMAKAEADYAIAQASKYWKSCPIAYDFEYDSVNYARKNGVVATKTLVTDMAIAFLQRVKEKGFVPVLYTNKDYMQNYFDINKINSSVGDVYIWYARYTSKLPDNELNVADVWQYTSTGRIAGVSGNVDMNHFYTNFLGGESVKKPTNEVTVKCNINILEFQKAANADGYKDSKGKKLVEDGIDGTNTQYVRKKIALQAKKSGNTYVVGSKGELVGWWQKRCNEVLGRNIAVDKLFGKNTRTSTIAVQKKFGLTQDGIAGYNSIQMLFYN